MSDDERERIRRELGRLQRRLARHGTDGPTFQQAQRDRVEDLAAAADELTWLLTTGRWEPDVESVELAERFSIAATTWPEPLQLDADGLPGPVARMDRLAGIRQTIVGLSAERLGPDVHHGRHALVLGLTRLRLCLDDAGYGRYADALANGDEQALHRHRVTDRWMPEHLHEVEPVVGKWAPLCFAIATGDYDT